MTPDLEEIFLSWTVSGRHESVLRWLAHHGLKHHPPVKANRTRIHRRRR